MIRCHTNLTDDAETLGKLADYLATQDACGLDHDPRWFTVLGESMGHRAIPLIAYDADGEVCGYLPLTLVVSHLFGRFLVSLPYLNRAGVIADDEHVAAALIDEAVRLADTHRVDYLELRHDTRHAHPDLGFARDEKVRMVLDMTGITDEAALWKHLASKVRNQIRKGDKHNLEIRFGGTDLLESFYEIFSINMRDLGTPVYPRSLFKKILETFDHESELAVTTMAGEPIAAALLIHDPKIMTTQVPSASCLRAFNFTNANMWMYHRLLLRATERNQTAFDFGRSSIDAGTYRFKKQWGATPEPTVWQYHLRHGDPSKMRPDSPGNRRKVEVWKKLPVWVTKLAGPQIVRGIP